MIIKELARGNGFTFWQVGDQVFRAKSGDGLDTIGQPLGKRWECSLGQWRRFRAVFGWAQDVESGDDQAKGGE
jgi:hypothetical protein